MENKLQEYVLKIMESIDSLCKDSTDTQYMATPKNLSKIPKMVNLAIGLHNNLLFIFECLPATKPPSSAKKHCETTIPETHKIEILSFQTVGSILQMSQ